MIKTSAWFKDISEAKVGCDITTNGGVVHTTLQGILPGYGMVWHHPEAITNILSFHKVQKSSELAMTMLLQIASGYINMRVLESLGLQQKFSMP